MNNTDRLLKDTLRAEYEPPAYLNASVVSKAKENRQMKRKILKRSTAAAVAAVVMLAGSVCAFAAYHLLSPSQVALKAAEDSSLAQAFESDDAVIINETVTSGGKCITLLGMVSGKDFTSAAEGISEDRTYAAVAIRNEDGTPMPDVSSDDYITYCVSPVISGKTFKEVNNGILNAGAISFVEEGIQYQLLECDSLASYDGVKLGVVERFGDEQQAFKYDEKTGIYSLNKDYEGTAALFDLPLE